MPGIRILMRTGYGNIAESTYDEVGGWGAIGTRGDENVPATVEIVESFSKACQRRNKIFEERITGRRVAHTVKNVEIPHLRKEVQFTHRSS